MEVSAEEAKELGYHMNNRIRWILTLFLEQYIHFGDNSYLACSRNLGLADRGIRAAIEMLIDQEVFTVKEISQELLKQYKLFIPSQTINNWLKGVF